MTHRAHVWQPCCYTWSPECTGYQAYKSTRFFLCQGFQILWRQHLTSTFCRHERSWKPRFSLGANCEKLGMHRFKRVSLRSWELVPVTLVLKTTWPCFLVAPQEVIVGSFNSQRRMMSISWGTFRFGWSIPFSSLSKLVKWWIFELLVDLVPFLPTECFKQPALRS